jgi:hypothetical protein
MPAEKKPRRASSAALAHLDELLDEALEQTFPASDAVAIDIDKIPKGYRQPERICLADGRHATIHRDIVVKFGRFLHRNRAMGRDTTPAEQGFLDGGGFAG